ncbi:MAG: hypothetical protein AB1467_03995 [Candidatus Diapherotrites archaeon]
MIITIAALPGTESREISKMLALQSGLRCISSDEIKTRIAVELNSQKEKIKEEEHPEKFKNIIMQESKKGDVVIDHITGSWLAGNADIKIFLNSSKKSRAKTLSEKEKIPLSEALERIELLEKDFARQMLNNYGINVFELEGHDLVLNMDRLGKEGAIAVINKFIEKMKK